MRTAKQRVLRRRNSGGRSPRTVARDAHYFATEMVRRMEMLAQLLDDPALKYDLEQDIALIYQVRGRLLELRK